MIVQSVLVSGRKSVDVGSNPTQTKFYGYLKEIIQCWIAFFFPFIWLPSCDYHNKSSIKINVATKEGDVQNEIGN